MVVRGAAQSGTVTATADGLPMLNTNNNQSNTSNRVAINNNAVNNNTTLGSFASSKNDDKDVTL